MCVCVCVLLPVASPLTHPQVGMNHDPSLTWRSNMATQNLQVFLGKSQYMELLMGNHLQMVVSWTIQHWKDQAK